MSRCHGAIQVSVAPISCPLRQHHAYGSLPSRKNWEFLAGGRKQPPGDGRRVEVGAYESAGDPHQVQERGQAERRGVSGGGGFRKFWKLSVYGARAPLDWRRETGHREPYHEPWDQKHPLHVG